MIALKWQLLNFLFQITFYPIGFFRIVFLYSMGSFMARYLFDYLINFKKLITPFSFWGYFFLLNQYISCKIFDVSLIHWYRHLNLSLNFLDSLHQSRNLICLYFLAFYEQSFLLTSSHFIHLFIIFLNFFLSFP